MSTPETLSTKVGGARCLPEPIGAAVSRAFRQRGYEGATMAVLSAETGLGRSSLYHHFPNGKEAMAIAALERVEALLRGPLSTVLTGASATEEANNALRRLLDGYYEGGELGCLLGTLAATGATQAVRARVSELTNLWIDLFAAFARRSGAHDPKKAAVQAVMVLQGGLTLSAATGDREHFKQALDAMMKALSI